MLELHKIGDIPLYPSRRTFLSSNSMPEGHVHSCQLILNLYAIKESRVVNDVGYVVTWSFSPDLRELKVRFVDTTIEGTKVDQ